MILYVICMDCEQLFKCRDDRGEERYCGECESECELYSGMNWQNGICENCLNLARIRREAKKTHH